jgi:hypothetical protein
VATGRGQRGRAVYYNEFAAPYDLTVPSSGGVTISFGYSTEFTLAAVQHDALVAQDHFQPLAVSITSPPDGGTVSSSPVTVTGSVSGGSGVKSVAVNHVRATVSGNTFTPQVPLASGANQIVARAYSKGGKTAKAQETVTLGGPTRRK